MNKTSLLPIPVLLLAAFALLGVACGGAANKMREAAERAKRLNDMKMIGLMYHSYFNANNKGPSKPDDLLSVAGTPEEKQVIQDLKSGKYTLLPDVKLTDVAKTAEGTSNTILAYETNPEPSGNRVVCYVDGSAAVLSSAEFSGKPQAKSSAGGKDKK